MSDALALMCTAPGGSDKGNSNCNLARLPWSWCVWKLAHFLCKMAPILWKARNQQWAAVDLDRYDDAVVSLQACFFFIKLCWIDIYVVLEFSSLQKSTKFCSQNCNIYYMAADTRRGLNFFARRPLKKLKLLIFWLRHFLAKFVVQQQQFGSFVQT